MSNTFVDIDELLETEKNLMRTIYNMSQTVVKLEEEVAQLRVMAYTLWHNSECLRWPGKCSDGPYELCEVCKAGMVVEGWEEQ